MKEPKLKWCRYCKWLTSLSGTVGFCEAIYRKRNKNSRGENCDCYEFDKIDTFTMLEYGRSKKGMKNYD